MSNFFTEFLADAQSASAATGVLPSVILAQWADETGYGGTLTTGPDYWNFAGLTGPDGLYSYPNEQAGVNAYVAFLLQSIYVSVRTAQGSTAQAVALGSSNWAASHYDASDYYAAGQPADGTWTPPNPGIDLLNIIRQNNLTQYDGAQAYNDSTGNASAIKALSALPTISAPPLGLSSDVSVGDFYINGQSLDLDVTGSVVTAQLDLSMTQASTFTLTLNDPDYVLINSDIFTQQSVVTFQDSSDLSFSLVSVSKQGTVLTVTFEAFVVAALRTAIGAITTAAGQMSRTDFAGYLVAEVQGAIFNCPPDAWLYAQDDGYDKPTQEQISRGTSATPLEDSWTCLQRLAAEIDWVCFECLGVVYFGPYSYLAQQPPVMIPVIGQGGIDDIDCEYDIGMTDTQLTITARAGQWIGQIGNAVLIQNLGPLSNDNAGPWPAGTWLISEIERDDVEEVELTITCVQPQPNLPEPDTGGAQAAVGAGFAAGGSQQSEGSQEVALKALSLAEAQIGKPYVWGGNTPAGFDCSGLVSWAYAEVGISVPANTVDEWNDTATFPHLPPGIQNLLPGDLVLFQGSDPPPPGHVAMVVSVNKGTNTVKVVDAFSSQVPLDQQIRYDSFTYVSPGGNTSFAGMYYGAIRPSP